MYETPIARMSGPGRAGGAGGMADVSESARRGRCGGVRIPTRPHATSPGFARLPGPGTAVPSDIRVIVRLCFIRVIRVP